ncbi:MAG TPA: phospholipase A [Tepidisphaeraceae bacterium]|nr:phospholipase A [Tepidisphaeraceae bacterium]
MSHALIALTSLFAVPAVAGGQAAPATAPAPVADPTPAVSTSPVETATGEPVATGLAEFARHFSPHEPIYLVWGPKAPNVKFQFSFKYALLNRDAPLAKAVPPLAGLHVAYSQTSLWDLDAPSNPFFDSSYRPEVLWSEENFRGLEAPGRVRLGLQAGVRHESNGRDAGDSRSLNIVYVRPIVTLGDVRDFHLTLAPQVFAYLGDLDDNHDIKDYRGHAELRATAGWTQGLLLAAIGRVGDDGDKGSVQLDLTYPLNQLLGGNFDVFLDVQGFYGHGESLLEYRERTTALRVGVALVR